MELCHLPGVAFTSTFTTIRESFSSPGRLPLSKMGLEGIVSKRLGSRYRSGRSPDWLKFKNPEAPAVRREAGGGLGQEWRAMDRSSATRHGGKGSKWLDLMSARPD